MTVKSVKRKVKMNKKLNTTNWKFWNNSLWIYSYKQWINFLPWRFSDSLCTLYKERRLKGERKGEKEKVRGKESKENHPLEKRKLEYHL